MKKNISCIRPEEAAPHIIEAISQATRIGILSHVNPDGDAIGSTLGVYHMLQAWHEHRNGAAPKEVVAMAPSRLPHFTRALPGTEHIQVYETGMDMPPCDLLIIVDLSDYMRLGLIYEERPDWVHACPTIIIDHHLCENNQSLVSLIDSQSPSCAELVYRLFREMEVAITPNIATCLLMGFTTDTQTFQTTSTTPATLHIAGELMAAGADHKGIANALYHSHPFTATKLMGAILSNMKRDGDLIWSSISIQMIEGAGAADYDSNWAVSIMASLEGMRACVLFKELESRHVKASFRSNPTVNVAEIAKRWGGGGHAQAAGATLELTLDEAQQEVIPVVKAALQGDEEVIEGEQYIA
jgi:phosphoesterase RecJ-like protein